MEKTTVHASPRPTTHAAEASRSRNSAAGPGGPEAAGSFLSALMAAEEPQVPDIAGESAALPKPQSDHDTTDAADAAPMADPLGLVVAPLLLADTALPTAGAASGGAYALAAAAVGQDAGGPDLPGAGATLGATDTGAAPGTSDATVATGAAGTAGAAGALRPDLTAMAQMAAAGDAAASAVTAEAARPVIEQVAAAAAQAKPADSALGHLFAQMKVSSGNTQGELATSTGTASRSGKAVAGLRLTADTGSAKPTSTLSTTALAERRGTVAELLQGLPAEAELRAAGALPEVVTGRIPMPGGGRDDPLGRPGSGPAFGIENAHLETAGAGGVGSEANAAASLAGEVAPEDPMKQQLQYWLNQKVQSAELTLDAGSANPVEVRISLAGNEAQVAFRTDQMQTRALLDASVSDLRQMFGNEGMLLSDVSVGGFHSRQSGGGNGGRDESSRNPAGASDGSTASATAAPVAVKPRLDGSQGRALDIFA